MAISAPKGTRDFLPDEALFWQQFKATAAEVFDTYGYLPIETADRDKAIRNLEATSRRTGLTQIFIETPYRNDRLLERLLHILQPSTMLCIGRDITSPEGERIESRPVSVWRKNPPELGKVPVIFLIHCY